MLKCKWYVSYKSGGAVVMKLATDRTDAIATAHKFLAQGVDVREIGPLTELRQGNVITAAALRENQRLGAVC
jgi:hypothetical protein